MKSIHPLALAVIALIGMCLQTPAVAQTSPVWSEEKVPNYLPHMTVPEVRDLLTRTDMVIIPVTALEQHGLHLPIGTDYYSGIERAKLIAARTDVLVAPILLPGQSPYHMGFEGTISLSSQTVQQVIVEAAESLMRHGFKRFLILNSHRHGGVGETSRGLYLMPDLVDLEAAVTAELTLPSHMERMLPDVIAGDPTALTVFLAEGLKAEETGKGTSADQMSSTGVWSERDPKEATAEQGRLATEIFVEGAVRFIERWKELRPIQ